MVGVALALVVAAQQPQVSATVDRSDALAGEVLTLTIRVEAAGGEPVRIADPVLTGLEIRGSRDVTQVRMVGGEARRVVTRELRLLAVAVGRASIGPVRVTHGGAEAATAPIFLTVRAPASPAAAGIAPRVRALVNALSPPAGEGDVVVEVLALPDTVRLGDQLDLVTVAWFPRDVRLQLRTPPTLDPPPVEGVWAYQQTTTAGIVTSRQAAARWYDLYLSHQVVFPLTAGTVRVGRATVTYVQPLSYSFLSRELQHEVQSESLTVTVRPQPAAGRPAGFSGAAGRDLAVTLDASPVTLPPGGAATVTAAVTGTGNVALWPEPNLQWPPGLRVYPGEVSVEVAPQDGFVSGTKRFSYLVVADSAGTHPVSGVSYAYFDLEANRYRVATARGLQLVAPPGTIPAVARPLPPPLLARGSPGWGRRAEALAGWLWALVFALPPLAAAGALAMRRLRAALPGPAVRVARRGPLEALDGELRDVLARLVGPASEAEGPPLTAALRAAGVEASLAAHATRVRERTRQAVFGPAGSSDPAELQAEVHEVLRALAGEAPGTARRALLPLVAIALASAQPAMAQAPRPDELYAAGAFRAAADSFAARVAREPRVGAYWYNLGAAYYRLGEDGRARAAWLRAARLDPRDPAIRGALGLLPADALAGQLTPVYPVTAGEALVAAAALWVLGWALMLARRARRAGLLLAALALVALAAAAYVAGRYAEPAAIVLRDEVSLRGAPFGSADADRRLYTGSAVRVRRTHGPWLLVERDGQRGWVLPGEVARL